MVIRVIDVSSNGNEVSYRLSYSRPVKKYLLDESFFVRYDSQVETASVPQSILAIPVVSMIAPIAWAIGADIEIDALDETYLRSLDKVRTLLKGWYPRFSTSGTLNVRSAVRNHFGGDRTGLLFSSGLDSLASYSMHKDEKPDLIPGCARDPRLHEGEKWACVTAAAQWLSRRDGVSALPVKTNLAYVNDPLLSLEFGVSSWYANVTHGLLLLSVCAPITAARGISRLLIASGTPPDRLEPWGSHPAIDNSVSWARVIATHDALDMSRQEKIRYMCAKDRECLTQLKVCHFHPLNCGMCEKCFRTIVGLCIEGIDPRNCGFRVDDKTLNNVKRSIATGRMAASKGEIGDWIDMQRFLAEEPGPDVIGSREFLTWLRNYDFSRYRAGKWRSKLMWARFDLLRLYQLMRAKHMARQNLRYLRYSAACYLHVTLYRGRHLLAASLRFRRPTS
ncbi:MAG TPA: hypothetical protein DCZ69_15425 [Syntrophobacteraceae bacterium]|nr:hypothetical protein [Syntrophobacteraceae bacterium]